MNRLLIRIGLSITGLALIFASGYLVGRQHGRVATLQAAVTAYQSREKIDDKVQNMDGVALCLALGGVREECAAIMRGVDKAAED